MRLRDAEAGGDLGLRAVAEEDEEDDEPLALVEPSCRTGDGGAVEQRVVGRLVSVDQVVREREHVGPKPAERPRDPQHRAAVAQVVADLAVDATREIRAELLAVGVAPVHGTDEGERPDLRKVFDLLAVAGVPPRNAPREWQVGLDQAEPLIPRGLHVMMLTRGGEKRKGLSNIFRIADQIGG